MTKRYRVLYWIFFFLSLISNIGPLTYYIVKAAIYSNLTYEKLALSVTVLIVIIMTLVCLINKVVLRSRMWIVLIGLYICLEFILTPLIIIAACQIIDEIIFTPLKNNFKQKLTIHVQFDKRMGIK